MAKNEATVSPKESRPIELIVFEKHEPELISLTQTCISNLEGRFYAKGLLATANVAEEHKVLSRKMRMKYVLEYVLTLMKESKEKSREIFDNFLDALDDEPSWELLRDCLCKLTLLNQCYCQIVHAYIPLFLD